MLDLLPREVLGVVVSDLRLYWLLSLTCRLRVTLADVAVALFAAELPDGQRAHFAQWHAAFRTEVPVERLKRLVLLLDVLRHGVVVGLAAFRIRLLSRGTKARVRWPLYGFFRDQAAADRVRAPCTTFMTIARAKPPTRARAAQLGQRCGCVEFSECCVRCEPEAIFDETNYDCLSRRPLISSLAISAHMERRALVFEGDAGTVLQLRAPSLRAACLVQSEQETMSWIAAWLGCVNGHRRIYCRQRFRTPTGYVSLSDETMILAWRACYQAGWRLSFL